MASKSRRPSSSRIAQRRRSALRSRLRSNTFRAFTRSRSEWFENATARTLSVSRLLPRAWRGASPSRASTAKTAVTSCSTRPARRVATITTASSQSSAWAACSISAPSLAGGSISPSTTVPPIATRPARGSVAKQHDPAALLPGLRRPPSCRPRLRQARAAALCREQGAADSQFGEVAKGESGSEAARRQPLHELRLEPEPRGSSHQEPCRRWRRVRALKFANALPSLPR
jgi:hypothetical protein